MSATAAQKQIPVKGILPPKIRLVVILPSSGEPEVSSKIEPTAAMAVTQEINKNTPLFGVTLFYSLYWILVKNVVS